MLHHDVRGFDWDQLKGNLGDYASQTHAADGGPEKLGVFFRRAAAARAIRENYLDLFDMSAKRTVAMMVLAVNVGRGTTAQGNKPGPGNDRWKPTARQQFADQRRQRSPRFRSQNSAI